MCLFCYMYEIKTCNKIVSGIFVLTDWWIFRSARYMLPCKFFSDIIQPMCLRKIKSNQGCISEKERILAHRWSEGTESTFFYEVLKAFKEAIFSQNRWSVCAPTSQ